MWCPTTSQQTWIAIHPETGEEFITGNCTHNKPNLAQIPAGGYFRELFSVPKGWSLVGADLANIEIRVLAHYLAEHGNLEYAQKVITTDMHWLHSKLAGFWTEDDREWPDDQHSDQRTPEMKAARSASKAFFFGYLYGQGSSIRGNTLSKHKEIHWCNKDTKEEGVS